MKKNSRMLALLLFLQLPAAAPAWASHGKALYEEHCAACHTIGGGDSVGPDLKGVADRRKAGWLGRIIAEPDRLTAESDPEQLALVKKWGMEMPNVGISPGDAAEIIEYLIGAGSPAKTAPAAAVRQGSVIKRDGAAPGASAPEAKTASSVPNGRELFFGTKKLSAGGPACAGCHSLSAGNMAAGGSLAAGLSKAFEKLGAAGIKAVLGNMPFPVKAAAFKGKPVTETEIADLAAFLEEAGKAGPGPGPGFARLAFAGLAAALGGLVFIALVWSGRKKKGVKDDILSRQAKTS